MSEERSQKPPEAPATALSPAAVGFTLGLAAVGWMVIKLLSQLTQGGR